MSNDQFEHDRLAELLAAAELNDLSSEERAELEDILAESATEHTPAVLGELLVALDRLDQENGNIPDALADRLSAAGRVAIATRDAGGPIPIATAASSGLTDSRSASARRVFTGAAALIAISAAIFAYSAIRSKQSVTRQYQQQLASLQQQIDENQSILDRSRIAVADAQSRLQDLDESMHEQALQLAQSEREKLELAQRLADATTDLRDAQLRIALYEEPIDPAVLAERRQQLLEVPDSIQIAWQPFDLPDAPAEQRDVRGDVVWSDELQQGYIRFVGLDPNDPNIEQYQVWVIDERGLEQKVSGGVFNASAEGEVIVPIEPGIDVGRVAIFAVTVENPGGTWVPDLSRRVVVAPRDG